MSPGSTKFAARLRKLPVLVGLATNAASFFAFFFFFFYHCAFAAGKVPAVYLA